MTDKQRTAVFVGSFDPFTVGHANIVDRTLQMFDRVVIGVGVNPEKKYMFCEQERLADIKQLYNDNPRIEVKVYHDWTADFAQREGACCIVKGVRTLNDYRYEQQQALFNRQRNGMETVILIAEKTLKNVSSTAVRQRLNKKLPTDNILPEKK